MIRNKPVVVGGDEEARHGIILAKNNIAKSFGIQTGNALWEARQKCPDLVVVPADFKKYQYFSKAANDIYKEYTDQVEPFGSDESWLDITDSVHLFGDGKTVADRIRKTFQKELGVTCSVGVSFNKVFAKLGSDLKKPNATTVIEKENFKEVVWPLPVSDLLMVGKATTKKLANLSIYTIGDLAKANVPVIKSHFGKIGLMLIAFANGQDHSPVSRTGDNPYIKSVGNSTTAPKDLKTEQDIRITLLVLCESVASRLRDYGLKCRTVQVSIRSNNLFSFERQTPMDYPCAVSSELFKKAYHLVMKQRNHFPLRSLGVRACNLLPNTNFQLSLFPEIQQIGKQEQLETAIDSIRNRFGHFSVQRGIMLMDKKLSNLDPKNDHTIHPISFLK